MTYRIKVTSEAKQEIIAAKQWYEEQQPDLGKDFAKTVKQQIESLKSGIVDHKIVFDETRRVLVKRFPYVIYYIRRETDKTVNIIAVLHERQNKK
jgi:plasmid stabilization system protein ParE